MGSFGEITITTNGMPTSMMTFQLKKKKRKEKVDLLTHQPLPEGY